MSFIRNRVALALIGLLLIGGISAAVAVLTTPQPLRAALVGAGQANAKPTATSAAMATTASSAGGTTTTDAGGTTTSGSSGTTAGAAPTATTSPAQPPASTLASGDISGQIASVSSSEGYFIMTLVNGSSVKVVVTKTTTYQGSAQNLASLRAGWKVEVQGTAQADGSFLARDVNSDNGN